MRYDIFSAKVECSACNHVYAHKGFPVQTPACPQCQSTEYELFLSGKMINAAAQDFERTMRGVDGNIMEEYKVRLTFLLLQIKTVHPESQQFPFLV